MKSSLTAVRNAYITAMQTLGYTVYDRQRKVQDYPYIVVGEQTEVQSGDQGSFGQIATINIEVYNGWNTDFGERSTSDTIVNAILENLLTKPYSLNILGFDMPMMVMDNILTSTEQTATHTIVTTVIRFRMHLFENGETVTTVTITDSGDVTLPVVNEQEVYFYVTDIAAHWELSFTDGSGTAQDVAMGTGAGLNAQRAIVVDDVPYMVTINASLATTPGYLTIGIQFQDINPDLPVLNDGSTFSLYAYNTWTNDTEEITFAL